MHDVEKIKLSVIVVTWNSEDTIAECINSIYQTVSVAFEIIVVDNNSSDNTVRVIKEKFSEVVIVEEDKNLGFSKAANIGARRSRGEYILMLNPDTVWSKGSPDLMVLFLDAHPGIGILGSKILESDRSTISFICKGRLPTLWQEFLHIFLLRRIFDWAKRRISRNRVFGKFVNSYYEKSEECGLVPGTCMLIRRILYERLGGFDDSLPMYLDDIDLCYRSKKEGFKNFYFADTEIIHLARHSTKKAGDYKTYDLLFLKAHLLYYRKNLGIFKASIYGCLVILSVPYLLVLDAIIFPFFLLKRKEKEMIQIIKKHIRYPEVIFGGKTVGI